MKDISYYSLNRFEVISQCLKQWDLLYNFDFKINISIFFLSTHTNIHI